MVADIEELEEMDASELHARRLNEKNEKICIPSRRWKQSKISGGDRRLWNIHLKPGIVRKKEKNNKFFKEYLMNYILQPQFKKTQRGMMRKLKVTSGTVIGELIYRHHSETQRQTVHAERRNISYSDEVHRHCQKQHIHHWMYCWRRLLERGWRKNCQKDGQDSQDLFYWRKGHQNETHGPGRGLTKKQTTSRPDDVWPDMEIYVRCSEKRKQNKDGPRRDQNSKTPDNWEEYSSLSQTTKNSSLQWKPLVESWKFRCLQQCLAKYRWRAVEKTHRNTGKRKTKIRLCCRCRRMPRSLYCKRDFITHYRLVHKFLPMPQALKLPDAKAVVEKEREKTWEKFRRGTWRKSETRKKWSMKQGTEGRKVHFASLMDICHLKNAELEP